MNKILSIIIPTYNMEEFLPLCLESLIIKKGRERLDVLIVNDGSKDNSSNIAHHYKEKYPDVFRVIDKTNGNYGSCINAALPHLQGKFVKILDADDTYDTENLQIYIDLLATINSDLVISDFITVDETGKRRDYHKFKFPSNKEFLFEDIDYKTFLPMHSVTYNTDIFKKIVYHQTEGVSYTDMEWIFHPMSCVNTVFYFKSVIYKYLIGRNGQTVDFTARLKRIDNIEKGLLNQIQIMINIPQENKSYKYLNNMIEGRIKTIYTMGLLYKNVSYDILSFDNRLKEYPEYYSYAESIMLPDKILNKEIPFVKMWRRRKSKKQLYKSPLFIMYRLQNRIKRMLKNSTTDLFF